MAKMYGIGTTASKLHTKTSTIRWLMAKGAIRPKKVVRDGKLFNEFNEKSLATIRQALLKKRK